jgi:uncharacterized protein
MKTGSPAPFAPTEPAKRIPIVDVLRGFALLGILLVNMELFSHPVQLVIAPMETSAAWIDRAAVWVVRFLAEGKFYSLFSLLFGLGFALQMARATEKGIRFIPLYLRRLLVLLGIGLLHAHLIWVGDILTLYALLGFVLILFRQTSPHALVRWVIVLLLIPVLFYAFALGMIALGSTQPGVAEQIQQDLEAQRQAYVAAIQRAYDVYANGGFVEITVQRVYDLNSMAFTSLFLTPSVFAMFLVGLWFARKKVFEDLEGNQPFFHRLLVWGLIIGVIGNIVFASLIGPDSPRYIPSLEVFVATLGQSFGAPALSLCYVAALVLLSRRPAWQQRLAPLAQVGRMALTNYLGQSVICTLIFYGYGLGLFGQVGKAAGLMLAVAIYAAQVWFSNWWLKRFQYGPMEWLWRSLTYARWQPMRKSVVSPMTGKK